MHPLRLHERLHAHARGRLVHEVDGLVRQPAVADIAHGERDVLAQRIVRDVQAVVRLEPFAQTAQDQQALLRRGLCNAHGLKAPLERRVLFDILAVLLERRRADDLQLVAPKRGLENVRRVDRALGRARADDRVQLVDEENHIPRSLHLVQDALDALFKVAAVLCAREHGRQVHTHNTLVAQVLGHVAVRNALRQPLGHRRLADAGLADEHGVILAAAREDLDGALDLPVAADDRVHLPAGCQLREVAAVLVERFRVSGAARLGPRSRLLRPGLILRPAEHVHDVRVDLVQVAAGRHDDARTGAVRLAEDAHEDVLRADVTVTEPVGVLGGQLDDVPRPGAEPLLGRAGHAAADRLRDHAREHGVRQRVIGQNAGAEPLPLPDDAEQEMLRAHITVPHAQGCVVRLCDRRGCPLCKPFAAAHRSFASFAGHTPLLSPGRHKETAESGKLIFIISTPSCILINMLFRISKMTVDFSDFCATMTPYQRKRSLVKIIGGNYNGICYWRRLRHVRHLCCELPG